MTRSVFPIIIFAFRDRGLAVNKCQYAPDKGSATALPFCYEGLGASDNAPEHGFYLTLFGKSKRRINGRQGDYAAIRRSHHVGTTYGVSLVIPFLGEGLYVVCSGSLRCEGPPYINITIGLSNMEI